MKFTKWSIKPLNTTHIDFLSALMNDPEVYNTGSISYFYPFSDLQLKSIIEGWLSSENKYFVITSGEVPVGMLSITFIDYINRRCEVGILISPEYQNTTAAFYGSKTVEEICFNQLGMYRIEIRMLEINTRAIKIAKHFKFELEGVQKKAVFRNGNRIDLHLYAKINP